MKCLHCEFENRQGVKFCEGCGAKLELICPECRAAVPLDRNFCGECDHDLRKPEAAPSIDYGRPSSYTPKFLADKILTSRSAIEGERKLVTVLFADVAGFTSMSEKLDPEDVHQVMDGCFRILMDEIHCYEGTVNEFRGDGVMALFGAPLAHEDHAHRACHAALAIQKGLIPYAAKLHNEYDVDFKMRIGLNSGPVVVGAIGDDLRMDYTALGDTVNLAARMETNAEPGKVLVSENTHKLARDFFKFRAMGKIQVKGKQEPQEAYELHKPTDVVTRLEASVARGLKQLVGREDELRTLNRAFEKARRGEAQVVDIVGEAGIGKSRLVYEFQNVMGHEATFLTGACVHYGRNMNFVPVIDVVRGAFGIEEGMTEEKATNRIVAQSAGSLSPMTPFYQSLLSLRVDDPKFKMLNPEGRKFGTFEAVKNLLLSLSANKPLVVFLEDVHWIDRISEELFAFFSRCILDHPLLMLSAYRPEGSPPWAQGAHYQRIGLKTLGATLSIQLVRNLVGGLPLDPDLEKKIVSKTGGNPFFVEEVVRELLERGDIRKKADRYICDKPIDNLQIPATVQGVLSSRMDRLSEDLKRTLQVASVIGRDFAFRLLKSITELGDELRTHLTNLVGLEVLCEKSLYPELQYIFKHALTQEVVYESLLKQRRREIHGRIARAIEELYPERLSEHYEMLAHHYGRSDNADKAVHYLLLAGEKSNRQDALESANDFFERAIQITEKRGLSLDVQTQVQLHHGWALSNVGLGAIDKVVTGFKNSIELARRQGLTEYERGGLVQLALVAYMLENKTEAERILDHSIARAREIDDKVLESISVISKAHVTAVYGHPNLGFEMLPDAERKAIQSGDTRAIGVSRVYRALIERWLGRPGPALELVEPLVATLRNAGNRTRLIILLWFHGMAAAEIGRIDKALASLREGIDLCEKFGIFIRLGALHNTLGYCYGEICQPEMAWRANMESRVLAERQMAQSGMGRRGYAEIRAQANVNLMENLFDQGKVVEALDMLESFKEESKGEVYDLFRHQWESRMNYLEARVFMQQGDVGRAAATVEKNLKMAREVHSKKREGGFLRLLGELQIKQGNPEGATGNLNESLMILKEVGNPRQLWQAHASAASGFEHLGRSTEARQGWGAAAEIIRDTTNGLSDRELRERFLNAEPIRNILSKAQL